MTDLATATCEMFETELQRRFTVAVAVGESLDLELLQVDRRGGFDPQVHKRQAFSLVFGGPSDPVLPQRIYALNSATLGTLELFLVPIGPGKGGMHYEAVFT